MSEIANKIQEVGNRLQFVIILGTFFPTTLVALFKYAGIKDESEISLNAGVIIFLLILCYLFFEFGKAKLNTKTLRYLNWCLFTTIASYGIVFLSLSFVVANSVNYTSHFLEFIFGLSFFLAMYTPLLFSVIVFVNLLVYGLRSK